MKRLCLLALVALACEIETYSGPPPQHPPPPPPGPAPAEQPPPAPGPAPGPASGAPVPVAPAPAAQGPCGAGHACFSIVAQVPGAVGASKLVVMWTPPTDDVKIAPEVGWTGMLAAGASSVSIPISAIKTPSFAASFPQVWGYVFAVPPNEPMPPDDDHAVGIAQMMFVHAKNAAAQAPYMKQKFPGGVAEGTAPYFMAKGAGSHDNFVLAKPGSLFRLAMCPVSAPKCDLPSPNPS